ncbi:MAG TPA: hypothetical protein VJ751_11730 [Pyrinomonadaceae bacterium]|nr:hypothetical protein [Pyrinomonadaceae bacterium]
MRKLTLLFPIALLCLFNTAFQTKSSLKFTVPPGWIEEERTSSMRVAQYRLPKAEGDTENGSVVLYYFGQGQGGSTAANIERWVGQMKQADSGSSKAVAREESFEVNGLKVTTVDVAGTYVAETTPGSGSFENKPGHRLLAAVVETPNGPYFLKLVGPEKTVARWNESFLGFLKSFEFK